MNFKVIQFLTHLSFILSRVLIKPQITGNCGHFFIHSGSGPDPATSYPPPILNFKNLIFKIQGF